MQDTFSPLFLAESLADEFALDARQRRVQILGFSSPELPARVFGKVALVEAALRVLVERALEDVQGTKDGAVMVETLIDKKHIKDSFRIGISDSRSARTLEEAERIIDRLLDEQTESGRLRDVLQELNTELQVDRDLLGRATRIYFTLALRVAKADATVTPLTEHARNLTMFLVANDPTPNRVVPYYARYAGITIYGAPTGSETIVELGRTLDNPVEILITAPPIEDMTPVEIAAVVRKADIPQPKMLYIAPWDDPSDRLKHIEAGFDDTLAKPFTKQQLFESFGRLAGRFPAVPPSRPSVLIVEDNPINAQLAFFQLAHIGFTGQIVTNGEEALDALGNEEFVAVLMDLEMPVMNGIETVKRIRSAEQQTNAAPIPVIAIAADHDAEREALEAGCTKFLDKPANLNQLRAALRDIVAPHKVP